MFLNNNSNIDCMIFKKNVFTRIILLANNINSPLCQEVILLENSEKLINGEN